MAKGQSTFRQLGKIDGRKYYQMKGVDGIVSQSINQGMSNRVKNDAAFANTRLNNAEFGAAGSTAGALVRSLSLKWRYLLVPFATGKMAKTLRQLMMADSASPWGQRRIELDAHSVQVADSMSQFSKNDFNDNEGVVATIAAGEDASFTATATITSLVNVKALAAGCTGCTIVVSGVACLGALPNASGEGYTPASVLSEVQNSADIDFKTSSSIAVSVSVDDDIFDSAELAKIAHIIVMPYRTVGSEKYIMQELCSFKTIAL